MFVFELRDFESADHVGIFKTAVPGPWGPGEVFQTGDGRRYRIRNMLENALPIDGDATGVWLVEPAD